MGLEKTWTNLDTRLQPQACLEFVRRVLLCHPVALLFGRLAVFQFGKALRSIRIRAVWEKDLMCKATAEPTVSLLVPERWTVSTLDGSYTLSVVFYAA